MEWRKLQLRQKDQAVANILNQLPVGPLCQPMTAVGPIPISFDTYFRGDCDAFLLNLFFFWIILYIITPSVLKEKGNRLALRL